MTSIFPDFFIATKFGEAIDKPFSLVYDEAERQAVIQIRKERRQKMIKANGISGKYLSYLGRPLVRQDKELYLGDVTKDYVFMMIMSEKDGIAKDVKIPDKVMVQLLHADNPMPERQSIVNGLSEALVMASAWLDRC